MSFLSEVANALFDLMEGEVIENTARYIPENNTCIFQFAKDLNSIVFKGSTAIASIEDIVENEFVRSNMLILSVYENKETGTEPTLEGKKIAARFWAEGGTVWTALQRALIKGNLCSNDDRLSLIAQDLNLYDENSMLPSGSFCDVSFK